MEEVQKFFKEIVLWKRVEDNLLIRYRCFHVLPDDRYVVKCSDYVYWPVDEEMNRQQNSQYLDSLFQDALQYTTDQTYSTLEEAISRHEEDFTDSQT